MPMPTLTKIKYPELQKCPNTKDECICLLCLYDCSECTTCIYQRRTEGNIECNNKENPDRYYDPNP